MKVGKIITSVAVIIAFVFISVFSAKAEELPTTEAGKLVKVTIDQLVVVVKRDKGKISDEQLRKESEDIIFPVFDFDEMSRRSLGPNWANASPGERDEFVSIFSGMLSDTYSAKVIDGIDEAKIKFTREQASGDTTSVSTTVTGEDDSISVEYRLSKATGKWKVCDVLIENVSLVANYRNEFGAIVRKDGMSGLIAQLKKKRAAKKEKEREKAAKS